MKGIVLFDDLDARENIRTLADETVELSLGTASVTLDLSTKHAEELRGFLEPYLAAGGAYSYKPTAGKAGVWPEHREFLKLFREWARANEINFMTPGGSYSYTKPVMEKFQAWLDEQVAAGLIDYVGFAEYGKSHEGKW